MEITPAYKPVLSGISSLQQRISPWFKTPRTYHVVYLVTA